ncbi:MAG: fibronectin type III domain-containing protein [Thermoplasmatota archaeon]
MLISTENVSGIVLYVGPGSTYSTIQGAVDDSNSGDTIVVSEGEYMENVSITSNGITLRGNDTSSVVIRPNDGEKALWIRANNVKITGMTLTDGELDLKGDNFTASDIYLNTTINTGATIDSSKNVTFINTTIRDSKIGGIVATNCQNINITGLRSTESSSEVVSISSSSFVDIINPIVRLGNFSTGFKMVNVTNARFHRPQFFSDGIYNIGAEFLQCANTHVFAANSIVNSTGFRLEGSDLTTFQTCLFNPIYDGSIGIEMVDSTNTSIMMNTYTILGGRSGISVWSGSNTRIDNTSFQVEGDDAVGMLIEGTDKFKVQDSNGMVLRGPSSFMQANGSSDVRIVSSLVNLVSDSSSVARITGSADFSMETNFLSSTGVQTTMVSLSEGTNNSTIYENMFDSSADGSICVEVISGSNILLMNNTITNSGSMAYGHYIEDISKSNLRNEKVQVSGEGDTGTQITGSDFGISGSEVAVIGRSSTGILVLGDQNGTVEGSEISVSGDLSTGLSLQTSGSRMRMTDLVINVSGSDSIALISQNIDGQVDISDVMINSTASTSWFATMVSGRVVHMDGLELISQGPGMMVEECEDGNIQDSLIRTPMAGLTFRNTKLVLNRSDISGLEIQEWSQITSIDSKIGQIDTILAESRLEILNTIGFHFQTNNGNAFEGVDVSIESWGAILYETVFFNSTEPDPTSGAGGDIKDLILLDRVYIDSVDNVFTDYNNVTVHAEGSSPEDWDETFTIDVSYPHTEVFTSPDIDLPQMPKNFTVRQLDTKESLFLNWDPNTDDTKEYVVYSLDPDSGAQGMVDRVPANRSSWTSADLGPSRKMFYWITAFDGIWESEPTELVQGTTKDLTPPAQPMLLSYVNSTMDTISMSWSQAGEDDLSGFKIFMSSPGSLNFELIATLGPEAREYTASDLEFSNTYRFQVQAFDTSDNHSPFSRILQASTDLPMVEVMVNAFYSEEGPKAGLPASNCSLELVSFNGSVRGVTKTNETGVGLFIRRDAYETYYVRIIPPQDLLGEIDARSGYLPATSDVITIDPFAESMEVNITMDYYLRLVNGTIRLKVTYGEGPRSGRPVFEAIVKLEHEDGAIVDERSSNADGLVIFVISDLPFRGRFRITPPEGVMGDPLKMISGYINQTSNFFQLTLEDPDQDFGEIALEYYSYVQGPEDLELVATIPYGTAVDLDSIIIIRFNQPVKTVSVIDSLIITPALKNPVYSWSDENRSLRIDHGGLIPKTTYTVIVGLGAESKEGTRFPAGYINNTWTFTTTAMPGTDDSDSSRYIVYFIVIGAIAVAVIILIYTRVRSNREEEEDLDGSYSSYGDYDDEYDDGDEDEEDLFDDDFPDDLAEQMEEDLPYDDEDLEDYYEDEDGFLEEDEEDFEEEDLADEDISEEEEDIDELEEEMEEDIDDGMTEEEEPEEAYEVIEEVEVREREPKRKKGKKKKKKSKKRR